MGLTLLFLIVRCIVVVVIVVIVDYVIVLCLVWSIAHARLLPPTLTKTDGMAKRAFPL